MTICPNSGRHCQCQPQGGVMCPYGPQPPFKPWPTEPEAAEPTDPIEATMEIVDELIAASMDYRSGTDKVAISYRCSAIRARLESHLRAKLSRAAESEPTVSQALLDSLSALLDRIEATDPRKRPLSLDERESIESAIRILSKLPRAK